MLLFVVAACMIPLLIQGRLMAQSSRQMQVERRIIDVQNQCQILSNKMSRNGYLGNSGVDTSGTDTELSMLADIFNGRILIVNSGFRIVKDTFSLAEGKICISDETLRCFQGETTSRYDTEKHYFILAVPIADTVQMADARKSTKTAGVMLVTVSTESMFNMEEALLDKASLYQLTVFILCLILAFFAVGFFVKPFRAIVEFLDWVAEGSLDEDISEESYRETKQISRAINKTLQSLKAVDQSRQEFVSNVSHELKTPLMAIQGYAEGIQAGVMDTGSAAEVILKESDRMTELVEELLDISKIDMGRQQLALSEMDIRELLYDSIRAVESAAAASGITIAPDFSEEPIMVKCDDTQMRRAVTNILTNGLRYARSELRLTCRADRRQVTIRIQDDGDGIAEADLPHIFDRFYMGRSGKSGIGLALTREIIHLHKGTIRARNGDTGAVFEISIPVSR